jgi:hypothetical protein
MKIPDALALVNQEYTVYTNMVTLYLITVPGRWKEKQFYLYHETGQHLTNLKYFG